MKKEIEKSNNLIAKFMGMNESVIYGGWYDDDKFLPEFIYDNLCENKGINLYTLLQFHESWDWLIPVVKKIYDLQLENEPVLIVRDALAEASLVDTFDAVVEFIEWYNEEK